MVIAGVGILHTGSGDVVLLARQNQEFTQAIAAGGHLHPQLRKMNRLAVHFAQVREHHLPSLLSLGIGQRAARLHELFDHIHGQGAAFGRSGHALDQLHQRLPALLLSRVAVLAFLFQPVLDFVGKMMQPSPLYILQQFLIGGAGSGGSPELLAVHDPRRTPRQVVLGRIGIHQNLAGVVLQIELGAVTIGSIVLPVPAVGVGFPALDSNLIEAALRVGDRACDQLLTERLAANVHESHRGTADGYSRSVFHNLVLTKLAKAFEKQEDTYPCAEQQCSGRV
jgi:hypothetical protein